MTQRHPDTVRQQDILRDPYMATDRNVMHPSRRLPTSFIQTGVTIESHRQPACVVAQSSCWTNPRKGTGFMITHDVCISADGSVRIEVNGTDLRRLGSDPDVS